MSIRFADNQSEKDSTCSKDIRGSTCGMHTFTRFYDQSDFNEISEIARNQSDFEI